MLVAERVRNRKQNKIRDVQSQGMSNNINYMGSLPQIKIDLEKGKKAPIYSKNF